MKTEQLHTLPKSKLVSIVLLFVFALHFEKMSAQTSIIVGLDHIGINVPDMDSALFFFTHVMGFQKVTEVGPFKVDDAWKKRYRIRKDAEVEKIISLRAGNGSNIELFQYRSPKRNLKQPLSDDVGWYHLAFYTDDIYKSVSFLKSKGIKVLNEPIINTTGPTAGETWVYFETPWGQQIELISYPNGKAYEKDNPTVLLWSPKAKIENLKQETMNSTEIEALAKKHLTIWSERDALKRAALIKQVYAEDVNVVDPFFVINGQLKLDEFINDLQDKYPDFTFSILKPIESHNNIARLFWALGSASKPDEITGQDVFVIEAQKIKSLYIFIDGLKK